MAEDLETRSQEHVNLLTHQLRESFAMYAAEADLTGDKLAELLHEAGITHFQDNEATGITEEGANFILENLDQLGLGDVLVLLEALGADVNVTVAVPVEARKKLLTPQKQHRLAVDEMLNGLPRKLQRGQ